MREGEEGDEKRIHVAIVGGGIAGLATALALLNQNNHHPSSDNRNCNQNSCPNNGYNKYYIDIWEASSPADFGDTSAGAALQITPNGLKALQGMLPATAVATAVDHQQHQHHASKNDDDNYHHNNNNNLIHQILQEASPIQDRAVILPSQHTLYDTQQVTPSDTSPSEELVFPTVMIRWGVLRQLLVDAIVESASCQQQQQQQPTCQLLLNRQVTGYHKLMVPPPDDKNNSNGETLLRLEYTSTTTATPTSTTNSSNKNQHTTVSSSLKSSLSRPYSLVIAADGKASIFRPTPLQMSSPRINFKAVVRLPETPSTAALAAAAAATTTSANSNGNMATTTATITYSFFAGPTACFMGPASRSDNWTYWAISVLAEQALQFGTTSSLCESWKQHLLQLLDPNINSSSSSSSSSTENQQATAAPAECQIYHDLIAATPATAIFRQESTQATIPDQFVLDDGHLVLVGDAAHAINASFGQATSFALEDAVTLAHCLSQQQQQQQQQQPHDSDHKASSLMNGLLEYSRQRVDRCLVMQQKSQERLDMAMKGQDTRHITQWIHHFDLPMAGTDRKQDKDQPFTVVA